MLNVRQRAIIIAKQKSGNTTKGWKGAGMTKQFLSLDNAVKIAVREFGIDKTIARQEFEQKCYISDEQYKIGYNDGLMKAISLVSLELSNE